MKVFLEYEPLFPSIEQSAYCDTNCEYAEIDTKCMCKCGGLHHGRSAYFDRVLAGVPKKLTPDVTLIRCGGYKAYVRKSEEAYKEFADFLLIAKPKTLGQFYSTKRKGEEIMWGLTEWHLEELGLMVKKPQAS